MLRGTTLLRRQRILTNLGRGRNTAKRYSSGTPSSAETKAVDRAVDESKLKWTERKEAPRWMTRMAPTKGGTKMPTPAEAAVMAVVAVAGYYAWFVEPPQRKESADDERR
mmetsp:Transcript_30216/g.68950  ORF Transcript_30216/g.68950 Transcript_30216/m.68950 type:complete len:110 (-) Transcript_30216:251-580(-)